MTIPHRSHERGQELMEYAITLPIFLLLVFGIFDLGRGVYYYSTLQNAAREGARYAVVNACDNSGVIALVKSRTIGLNPADITVPAPDWGEDTVQVTVQFSYQLVTPIVSSFFPSNSISLESDSTMQRETWLQPDCSG